MSAYFFLRYGIAGFLLVGWLLYQLFVKKAKWSDLSDDGMAVLFFIVVWVGLAYFFTT